MNSLLFGRGFFGYPDPKKLKDTWRDPIGPGSTHTEIVRSLSYRFHAHDHPYVSDLVERLVERSIEGLEDADTETKPGSSEPALFAATFGADHQPSSLVVRPYPVREIDFSLGGGYSAYNWELFYHVPLTIGIHLSRNQRFAEAQRWFEFIFDPADDSAEAAPSKYWKVKPFKSGAVNLTEDILINLSTGADSELKELTIAAINRWRNDPFRPHLVAAYRPSAYMMKAVFATLDNLIDWGDALFRQDTIESINEATSYYIKARNILGPRPQPVPRRGSVAPTSYETLRPLLDAFSNTMVRLESDIAFDGAPHPLDAVDASGDGTATIETIGRTLYFCLPPNPRLLAYWDTVDDRLFKIHNSLNLAGVFRQLPLFDPPIDPGLLARAAAAGLDIGAAIAGVNQPLPLVRFQVLIQKANEICQEVKNLGGALLSAMEKEDNEAFAVMRARHERTLLGLGEMVRYAQLQETIKAREGVEKTLLSSFERYRFYERQLGRSEAEISLPALDPLDRKRLAELKFSVVEPELTPRDISIDIDASVQGDPNAKKISSYEKTELDWLEAAQLTVDGAALTDLVGAVLNLIPYGSIDGKPLGVGAGVEIGGSNLGAMVAGLASAARSVAQRMTFEASRASRMAGYARRELDWAFQSASAAREINQIIKQLRGAQIREAIAERELANHREQMKNAAEVEDFLADEKNRKKTNQALYAWMKRETKGLHDQALRFATEIARKAMRALQHELGDRSLDFLTVSYASGREGLLAGETLSLDLRRMEMAYHDLNRREYELSKHVSLSSLDPQALLRLRRTGRCTITVPEEVFDIDGAGQYFRRLRNVSLSIPSVVGPYTGVACRLTLLKSSIRHTPIVGPDGYARSGLEDARFSDHYGSTGSIVTSTGLQDSGLFEVNLRDDRYLPFEGAGAIGEWQIELPADLRNFDYETITDVILHVRYTAREGGEPLRQAATRNIRDLVALANAAGSARMFSVRHEFPTEWSQFKRRQLTTAMPFLELRLPLGDDHYPFWTRGLVRVTRSVYLHARFADARSSFEAGPDSDPAAGDRLSLARDPTLGLVGGTLPNSYIANPAGPISLFFDTNAMEDLWLTIRWSDRAGP